MSRSVTSLLPLTLLGVLAACSPDYSPNTYSASAVQQANKVEAGIIVGFRQVAISTNGTVGAVTGGAAGGILGSQVGATPLQNALGGVTGTAVGALVGSAVEHAATDTTGWEYIVRKHNGDLLSVTQKEEKPLPLGQKVLLITGAQARIIPDYSYDPGGDAKADHKEEPAKVEAKPVQPPAPIIIIATPTSNGLPSQVTVPDPNGGAPTIIPLPTNLRTTTPGGIAAAAVAPVAKELLTPPPPAAPDSTTSTATEPEKVEAPVEQVTPDKTAVAAPSAPAPAPVASPPPAPSSEPPTASGTLTPQQAPAP